MLAIYVYFVHIPIYEDWSDCVWKLWTSQKKNIEENEDGRNVVENCVYKRKLIVLKFEYITSISDVYHFQSIKSLKLILI